MHSCRWYVSTNKEYLSVKKILPENGWWQPKLVGDCTVQWDKCIRNVLVGNKYKSTWKLIFTFYKRQAISRLADTLSDSEEWLLLGVQLLVSYPRQCIDGTVKNIRTSVSSGLTNRAVCNLASDVITGDLGSIFGWVNECLANQTHSKAYSDAFTSVTLLENKDISEDCRQSGLQKLTI
jgi:hypothetical protein